MHRLTVLSNRRGIQQDVLEAALRILTDACAAALRALFSAAQRER
jgi:hypothetical protein